MNKFKCRECNKKVDVDQFVCINRNPNRDFQTTYLCINCFNKNKYIECEYCKDLVKKEYIIDKNGHNICEKCKNYCAICHDCNNVESDYDVAYCEAIDGFVCRNCVEKNYHRCNICGDFLNDEETCCDSSYHKEEKIQAYSYKPTPKFFSLKKEKDNVKLFMGVELEMGLASTIDDVYDFIDENNHKLFYFKKDCSIPDYGCEVVTHPASLCYHRSMTSKWKKLLSSAIRHGLRGFETKKMGIHVHVNKDFFNPIDCAKLDLFVNNYKVMFKKLSRRNSDYATYRNKHPLYIGKSDGDRYTSINFDNTKTVEFRMFRSTLKYSSFIATLELVDAISNFVKNNEFDSFFNVKNETISNFVNFIFEHNYIYLKDFLFETKILKKENEQIELNINVE